jgi:hypothetical protein
LRLAAVGSRRCCGFPAGRTYSCEWDSRLRIPRLLSPLAYPIPPDPSQVRCAAGTATNEERYLNMKAISLATALVAATLAFAPPVVHAQKGMDMIKSMDTDKDGMISKPEFMRMMEQKFDMMDKEKKGKLTPADVAKSIAEIQRVYGSAN